MENEVKQRNQRNRRRERAQRMQAQRESKVKDGDSGEDESPAREKPPRPPARRKKSKEPLGEEDIIDGFAIMAFRTYEDLEAAVKCASSPRTNALSAKPRLPLAALPGDTTRNHPTSFVNSHGITLLQDAGTSDDSGRASERLTGSSVAPRDPDSSRDRLSDASSRCSSGKGYICDSEGDDDKASPENSRNPSPRYHDASMEDASDAGSLFRVTGAAGAVKNELVARGGSGGALALSRAPVGGSASPAPAPLPQPAPSPAPAALPPPALPPPPFRADTPHRPNGAHIPTLDGHAATQIPRAAAAAGPDTPERPASNNKLQPGARAAADSPTPAPPAPPAPSPLFPSHTAYQAHSAATLPDYRHTNHETRTEPPPAEQPHAPLDLHAAHHAPSQRPPHVPPTGVPQPHPSLAGRVTHAQPHTVMPGQDVRNASPASQTLPSVPTSFTSRVASNGVSQNVPLQMPPASVPNSLPSQVSATRPMSPVAPTSRPYPPSIGSSHVNSSMSSSIHSHSISYQNQASLQKHSAQPVYASRPLTHTNFSVANHITSAHMPPTTANQPVATHLGHPINSHSNMGHPNHTPISNSNPISTSTPNRIGSPLVSHITTTSTISSFTPTVKHPGLSLPPHPVPAAVSQHQTINHMDTLPVTSAPAIVTSSSSSINNHPLVPPVIDSRQQMIDSRQPIIDSRQPVLDSRQPVLDSRQPVVDSRQPVIDSRQPILDSRQPILDSRQPVLDSRQPVLDSRQPMLDSRQPILDSRQPVLDARQPNMDSRQPVIDSRQSVVDSRLPVLDSRQPVIDARQPVIDARQPIIDSRQPVPDLRQPVIDSRQPVTELPPRTESPMISSSIVTNGYPASVYSSGTYPPLYAPYASSLQHSPYLPPAAASPRNSADTRTNLSASPLVAPKTPKGVRPHTPGSLGTAGAHAPLSYSPRGHSPTRERESFSSNISSLSRSTTASGATAVVSSSLAPAPLVAPLTATLPAPLPAPIPGPLPPLGGTLSSGLAPLGGLTALAAPTPTAPTPAAGHLTHTLAPVPTVPSISSSAKPPAHWGVTRPTASERGGFAPAPPLFGAPLPPPNPNPFSAESLFQTSPGADLLRRELDSRFLAAAGAVGVRTELHHHQHQHTHVHQHPPATHAPHAPPHAPHAPPHAPHAAPHAPPHAPHQPHAPPPPHHPHQLLVPHSPLFKDVGKMSSLYRTGIGLGYPYSSSLLHPTAPYVPPAPITTYAPKPIVSAASDSATKPQTRPAAAKTGKWNAMHVRIAWEIYNHQQKEKASGGVVSSADKDKLRAFPAPAPPPHAYRSPYDLPAPYLSHPPLGIVRYPRPPMASSPMVTPSDRHLGVSGVSPFGRYGAFTGAPTPFGLSPYGRELALSSSLHGVHHAPLGLHDAWRGVRPPVSAAAEVRREHEERERARREREERERRERDERERRKAREQRELERVRARSPLRNGTVEQQPKDERKELPRPPPSLPAYPPAPHWDPYRAFDPLQHMRFAPLVEAAIRAEEDRAKMFSAYAHHQQLKSGPLLHRGVGAGLPPLGAHHPPLAPLAPLAPSLAPLGPLDLLKKEEPR